MIIGGQMANILHFRQVAALIYCPTGTEVTNDLALLFRSQISLRLFAPFTSPVRYFFLSFFSGLNEQVLKR